MKRWIAALLAVVMLFSLVGCNKKKTNTSSSEDTEPLTPVGTYESDHEQFPVLRDNFYDYFLGLLGCSFVTEIGEDGKFNEDELVKFALVQLSYAGYIPEDGFKKSQIDRMTRRFFSQKTEKLDSSTIVTKDATSGLYYPTDMEYAIGQFMVLRSLTVEENGLCTALFDRITPSEDVFETMSEDVVKSNLIDGFYDEVGEAQAVELQFRERDTAAFGYYVQIISLKEVDM